MRKHIHFIGIGGIGVSALARAFLHQGWRVSGSDAVFSPLLKELKKEGIRIFFGHRARNIKKFYALVVFSLAVRGDNPERVAAKKLGIPTQSYPQALGALMERHYTIAISGSHGKSTTTAMLAHILVAAGLDPTVIIGTKLSLFGNKNFRPGKGTYLLVEADEWDRAFLHYYPNIVGITNVDREHLDTYRDLSDVKGAFREYASHVPRSGYVIVSKKERNFLAVAKNIPARVVKFGAPKKKWKLVVPGAHNQQNAELAWTIARILGVKKSVASRALSRYPGAWRRLERLKIKNKKLAVRNGVVYADYGHHPAEIRATLSALRERHPYKKLVVIYQPHQIERLTKLFGEFTRSFSSADEVWCIPTYQVKGREYRGKKRTSEELAKKTPGARYFPFLRNALRALEQRKNLRQTCVVIMGAGDIDENFRSYLKTEKYLARGRA